MAWHLRKGSTWATGEWGEVGRTWLVHGLRLHSTYEMWEILVDKNKQKEEVHQIFYAKGIPVRFVYFFQAEALHE